MKLPYLTTVTRWATKWSLTAGVTLAATLAIGCGSSPQEAICEQTVNCRGGNDRDIEACVASREADERLVDEIGCTEEYELYFQCITDRATCKSEDQGITCMTDEDCLGRATCNSDNECELREYTTDEDDCRAEGRAFTRCFNLD